MNTLVERLRDNDRGWVHPGVADEAADEIERLREILEQVVDDFGEGHCVCEQTKQWCIGVLAGKSIDMMIQEDKQP